MYLRRGGVDIRRYPYQGRQTACNTSIPREYNFNGATTGSLRRDEATFEMWNASRVLSVVITVPDSLMYYKSGIFNDPKCETASTGLHAVTLNGYSNSGKYWILRNSWGATWGERGYMRLAKGSYGTCGLYNYGVYIY